MPYLHFDLLYFVFLAPAMLLGFYAQWKVMDAYRRGRQFRARSGVSGAETAYLVMRAGGVEGVRIEGVDGNLTDHYSPGEKTLRLSGEVAEGRSLAALGIAAHEAGHAVQDARRYPLLVVRNAIVPLAQFGSIGSIGGMIVLVLGFALSLTPLVWLGVGLFSLTVLFQLVNLPMEYDASRRARRLLLDTGLITVEEEPEVARVLNAAALTYVAATVSSLLTLAYFLFRGFSSSRED